MPRPARSKSRAAKAGTPDVKLKAPTLAELQDSFQKAVIADDEAVLALIPANSRTTNQTLLGVYRFAYMARLVDIAASDYACLSAFMGAEAFGDAVRAYFAAHPSHTPNARWASHKLPEFLAAAAPWSGHPVLAELAYLERAIADAFDAADDTAADLSDLRSLPPEDWEHLVLTPHSSAQRIELATKAYDIWLALKDETEPPPVAALTEPLRVLVWREVTASKVRPLGAEEAMLWNEAAKGVPFGALCELAAVFDDPDNAAVRAAQYLAGWLGAGMLASAVPVVSEWRMVSAP